MGKGEAVLGREAGEVVAKRAREQEDYSAATIEKVIQEAKGRYLDTTHMDVSMECAKGRPNARNSSSTSTRFYIKDEQTEKARKHEGRGLLSGSSSTTPLASTVIRTTYGGAATM